MTDRYDILKFGSFGQQIVWTRKNTTVTVTKRSWLFVSQLSKNQKKTKEKQVMHLNGWECAAAIYDTFE